MKTQTVFRIKIICLKLQTYHRLKEQQQNFQHFQQEQQTKKKMMLKNLNNHQIKRVQRKPEINIKKWVINQQKQERRINKDCFFFELFC